MTDADRMLSFTDSLYLLNSLLLQNIARKYSSMWQHISNTLVMSSLVLFRCLRCYMSRHN